jgi:hypothetical protein
MEQKCREMVSKEQPDGEGRGGTVACKRNASGNA